MVNSIVTYSRIFSTTNDLLSASAPDNFVFMYIATPPPLRVPLVIRHAS